MVRMDQRITLQTPTLTPDGAGGQTSAWGDVPSVPVVWAHVQPLRGNERLDEDRPNARGMYVFTIRNRTDLDERCRIVWRGEQYNIRSILREGVRTLYLKIEAERGAADLT